MVTLITSDPIVVTDVVAFLGSPVAANAISCESRSCTVSPVVCATLLFYFETIPVDVVRKAT